MYELIEDTTLPLKFELDDLRAQERSTTELTIQTTTEDTGIEPDVRQVENWVQVGGNCIT